MPYKPDQLLISENAHELFQDSAASIVKYANECVNTRGLFSVALAGGSTPERLYLELSRSLLTEQMPWQSCQFFFGDERMVPHDHADSNYAMAKRALFDRAPIPANNIHPIPTSCPDPRDCATEYEQLLTDTPVLDLVLLGIGQDGHTASLFPGTDILDEEQKNVAAVYVKKFETWRISLTYPYINRSRRVMILAQGTDKAAIVDQLFHAENPQIYPVAGIRPSGQLIWHLDRDARPSQQGA